MNNERAHVTVAMAYLAALIILSRGWWSTIANRVREISGVQKR